jgi:hypothetical protein
MRWPKVAALLAAALLPGCDGLFTGDAVTRFPLTPDGRGGYAPLRLSLGPDMNPLALNLHAQYAASATEAGKWNRYHARLSKEGVTVAEQAFHVNNTSHADSPTGQTIARTMLVVEVRETADYDLAIEAASPVEVTLTDAKVELRRNVRTDTRR